MEYKRPYYVDIELQVTSRVFYLDGHSETGPSTTVCSRAFNKSAQDQAIDLAQSAIDKLHETSFARRLRLAWVEGLQPDDIDTRATIKTTIKYTVTGRFTATYEDGTSRTKSESYEITRPV